MLAYDGGGCMCGSQTEARGDVQTTKYSLGGGVHGSWIYTHVTVQLHMGGLQCTVYGLLAHRITGLSE